MKARPERNGFDRLNIVAASIWISAVGLLVIHTAARYVQHYWG